MSNDTKSIGNKVREQSTFPKAAQGICAYANRAGVAVSKLFDKAKGIVNPIIADNKACSVTGAVLVAGGLVVTAFSAGAMIYCAWNGYGKNAVELAPITLMAAVTTSLSLPGLKP